MGLFDKIKSALNSIDLDRLDGFWENNGICLVYPKSYVGTKDEKKLMQVLDEVAESYKEENID